MRRSVTRRLRQLGSAMGTDTLMNGSKVTLTWPVRVGVRVGAGVGVGVGVGVSRGQQGSTATLTWPVTGQTIVERNRPSKRSATWSGLGSGSGSGLGLG